MTELVINKKGRDSLVTILKMKKITHKIIINYHNYHNDFTNQKNIFCHITINSYRISKFLFQFLAIFFKF